MTNCWRGSARRPTHRRTADERPDFVFYTGCNVLKTPHIALLALDVMDTIGATYQVMGGPSHCCGVVQIRTGDVETSGRFAQATMDKLASSKSGQVVSWCPSCHIQFTETTLPTVEKVRGAKPFEMTPFMLYLRGNLDRLRPHLRERVPMRIALHKHPGVHGVVEAAEDILRAVPGVELVDLKQPAIGAMTNYFRALPALRRELQQKELDAAEAAGIDALVAVYHADHRELCAHEAVRPFQIMNMLEIVGASMGLHRDDNYKRLKIMNDVDAIAADCRDLVDQAWPRSRDHAAGRSWRCSRSSRCRCGRARVLGHSGRRSRSAGARNPFLLPIWISGQPLRGFRDTTAGELLPHLARRIDHRMDVAREVDRARHVHGEGAAQEFLGAVGRDGRASR